MKSNVSKLNPKYTKGVTNPNQAMYKVRMEMYEHHISDLSDHTGISKGCLYAIRSGRTKWPRGNTFFTLIKALRLTMYLTK